MSSLFSNRHFHTAHTGTDLDKMVDRMLESGIGPWYYGRSLKFESLYRGDQHDLVISVAFSFTGDQMIEMVVQDNETPSSYKDFLKLHPDGGLHHIAYWSDDLEASLEDFKAQGKEFVRVQEFIGSDGKPTEIYLEPKDGKDPVLMQVVLPCAWDDAFLELKKIASEWDGTDPKRNMLDLLPPAIKAALSEGHAV